jgi:ribokinase
MSSGLPVLVVGRAVRDLYLLVDRYPAPGQEARIDRQAEFVGGSALNIAVTLGRLGVEPHLVACVGDDAAGARCLEHLAECGLATDLVAVIPSSPTAISISIVDPDGERTFLTAAGPARGWSEAAVVARMQALDPRIIVVSGYALADPATATGTLGVIRAARPAGRTLVLDPGPAIGIADVDVVEEAVASSTWLLANAAEVEILGRMLGGADIAARVKAPGGAVIKDGGRGATMHCDGAVTHAPGLRAEVVDTTGAGDAFAAGFVAALADGRSAEDALAFANACGAWATTFLGPHGSPDVRALKRAADVALNDPAGLSR